MPHWLDFELKKKSSIKNCIWQRASIEKNGNYSLHNLYLWNLIKTLYYIASE